jgi:hypothetical protein
MHYHHSKDKRGCNHPLVAAFFIIIITCELLLCLPLDKRYDEWYEYNVSLIRSYHFQNIFS